jgi:ABC-type transport system involved in multi-copper enzyme maturation permease subunit
MSGFALRFSIHPTGADSTYRRLDYLRGSLVSIVLAGVLLGLSLFASTLQSTGALAYVSFGGVLLGLVSLATAIIFIVQAVVGSPEPVSFALPPNHVPVKYRDRIRAILVNEWNPQRVESTETHSYDSYLAVVYGMASHNLEPEGIASDLQQIESSDGLVPGSTEAERLEAAEQLLALVIGRPLRV